MMRDEEFAALMRELKTPDNPHIDKPDKINVAEGALCFVSHHRVCGADCAAFGDPNGATPGDRCNLLVYAREGVEALVMIAEMLKPRKKAGRPVDIQPPEWRKP